MSLDSDSELDLDLDIMKIIDVDTKMTKLQVMEVPGHSEYNVMAVTH